MADLIIGAIFVISFGGLVFILARKLPLLATLPKSGKNIFGSNKIISGAQSKIQEFFAFFSNGIFLHKILSWVKCRILKVETWIDDILQILRKKAKEQRQKGKK